MQSFAFDNLNGHIYFVATKPGSTNGDLWVTKTDLSGSQVGSMALHGFGHGVQIAVEPAGGTVYLWSEWRASPSGFGDQRLSEWALPDRGSWGVEQPFQGFTGYGEFVYLLEGKGGETTSYLTSVDLNSGHVMHDRFPTTAGESLPNREPEGMAIRQSASTGPLLAFGFSSGTGSDYRATAYYKSDFV